MASLIFSAVLLEVLTLLVQRYPHTKHWWYLDDGTLIIKAAHVQGVLDFFDSDEIRSMGFVLNREKTALVFKKPEHEKSFRDICAQRNKNDDMLHDILSVLHDDEQDSSITLATGIMPHNIHSNGGFPLLGTAIGSDKYCAQFVKTKIWPKVSEGLSAIAKLPSENLHEMIALVTNTQGFCKYNHILRTLPLGPQTEDAVSHCSTILRAFFVDIGFQFTDLQWKQASLSISRGGLSARDGAAHHGAAFLASALQAITADDWLASAKEMNPGGLPSFFDSYIIPAINDINTRVLNVGHAFKYVRTQDDRDAMKPLKDSFPLVPRTLQGKAEHLSQRALAKFIDSSTVYDIINKDIPDSFSGKKMKYHQARVICLLQEGVHSFLNVAPNRHNETYMCADDLSKSIRHRFGMDLFASDNEAGCPCCANTRRKRRKRGESVYSRYGSENTKLDALGRHALSSCQNGGDKQHRHNAMRDCIAQAARGASGVTSVLIEQSVAGKSNQRGADVLVTRANGQDVVDGAVTSLRENSINIAVKCGPGAIAEDYAKKQKTIPFQKRMQNAIHLASENIQYIPVVADEFGGFAPSSLRYIKKIGHGLAARRCLPGSRSGFAASALFQVRLQCIIARYNARCIRKREQTASSLSWTHVEYVEKSNGVSIPISRKLWGGRCDLRRNVAM